MKSDGSEEPWVSLLMDCGATTAQGRAETRHGDVPVSCTASAIQASDRPAPAAAAATAQSGGALVFDLNYHEHTTDDEAGALCRQLTMSFATNRRAANPFPLLVVGGVGVPESEDAAAVDSDGDSRGSSMEVGSASAAVPLIRMLSKSNWWSSPGVHRTGSATPWVGLPGDVVYLTADSPHALEDLPSTGTAAATRSTTYVVGGIVDRVEKPGLSYRRAVAAGIQTARLPLERFLQLRSGGKKAKAGGCRRANDITTLAVVQMLLLFRENGGRWGDAISRCPALRCAPLRKYVRWLPPYQKLNTATRQDIFAQSSIQEQTNHDQGQGHQNKRKDAPRRSADEQVANADSNKRCEACGAGFASRNALFRHLNQCVHASEVASEADSVQACCGDGAAGEK